MEELIKIHDNDGKKAVSARELHSFLESKKDFSDWIKHRIKKYELIENQDYVVFPQIGENPNGGRPQKEYALTIDCAKELAMVEGNAKGKKARQYFIACENRLKEIARPLSPAEQLLHNAQLLVEQEKRLNSVETKVLELEAKTKTHPDFFTVAGYGTLIGIPVNLTTASIIGRKASKICKERGITPDEIPDPRFGRVKTYPKTVLNEVFQQPIN